jgi:hypothetical protein
MKVHLLDARGHDIADCDWDSIPRIGEGVLLSDPPDPYRVRDVVWDMAEGEPVVRIRLGLFDPLIDTKN